MTTDITFIIIREHSLVEAGPCTCKDHVSEVWMSLKDFQNKYSIEDLDNDFDLIGSDIVDAASKRVLSEEEVREILRDF